MGDVASKDENGVKEEVKEETKVEKQMNSQAAGDNVPSFLESGNAESVHVICQCGQVKVVRCVRKESANKGRKFFSCPKKLQLLQDSKITCQPLPDQTCCQCKPSQHVKFFGILMIFSKEKGSLRKRGANSSKFLKAVKISKKV